MPPPVATVFVESMLTIATLKGRELGHRFDRNPFHAARALGIRVEFRAAAEYERQSGDARLGHCYVLNNGTRVIEVKDAGPGDEQVAVMAHELGHAVMWSDQYLERKVRLADWTSRWAELTEQRAERFGRAFLGFHDPAGGLYRAVHGPPT